MIGLEIIPISTLLTLVTTQVLEIAVAAKDVLVEKESFQKLSRYLFDIEPVLKELKERCFKDLTAANQALSSLKADLERAHKLVDDCKDKSKFYLLINCRTIVKDAQVVTREIGKDLELLSLAGTELSLDLRDNLGRLKNQFLSAEYQASQTRLEIVDKLEMGIREHRTDQGFANDLIVAIARAVGVPVNPSEISKELSSFKREKEFLAERKARQEEAFMEQVIQLLSKADAAYTSDIVRQNYTEVVNNMSGGFTEDEPIEPLVSFTCPLKRDVMEDPVIASSNQTYERNEIERWFSSGNKIDPVTHAELSDFSLRPNNSLRKTIQEWTERNYCIRIRKAKKLLETRDPAQAQAALDDLCKLCEEKSSNTEWIAAGNVIPEIVEVLKVREKQVQKKALGTLHNLVRNNVKNRDEVVQVGGLDQVVKCLGKSMLSHLAVSLLLELLQGDGTSVCEKLCDDKSAFFYLVMLQNEQNITAKLILDKLSDRDENIVRMASMSYFEPLITSLIQGSDESKVIMARAIGNIESLSESNKSMLGERGVIQPLLHMMLHGNMEARAAALGAIQNLASNTQNQQLIANAGGFSILMDQLTSSRSPQSCRESAAIALKHLTLGSDDVLANDTRVDLNQVLENLFGLLGSSAYGLTIRAHILQILLGLAQSSERQQQVHELIIGAHQGIPLLVTQLESAEKDVRDSAIYLLSSLSERAGGAAISERLIQDNRLEFLITLISNGGASGEIRAAVSTILANFPINTDMTQLLLSAGALHPLLSLMRSDNTKVAQAAVIAIERFTQPSDRNLQKELAEANIHSTLVTLLATGTIEAKAGAARALRNFSVNTPELSVPAETRPWCCFLLRPTTPSVCRLHGGVCGVTTTFCIMEANALPRLIALLDEPATVAAQAAVEALQTLVGNNNESNRDRAIWYLHEVNAVDRALGLLSYGTDASKERTVELLASIFSLRKMMDAYGLKAKLPLVELASNGPISVKRKAARVLAQLSMIQDASSYFGDS